LDASKRKGKAKLLEGGSVLRNESFFWGVTSPAPFLNLKIKTTRGASTGEGKNVGVG